MSDEIETVLHELRLFPPPHTFARQANVNMKRHEELRRLHAKDPDAFWREQAKHIDWIRPFQQVLEWKEPFAKWFVGGELNVSANCLDRHLTTHRANKAALIFEGEPGDHKVLTYKQLARDVGRAANALKRLGVAKGDRVAIYMPLIPEAVISMLACARLGAIHSVIFGGFSAEALKDRINDAGATIVITADGGWRKHNIVPLKVNVDAALEQAKGVRHVLVVKRTGQEVPFHKKRDIWWHDAMKAESSHCEPAALDSEHPLFILYTSGTTGKPKGVVHTTGGYLVWANRTCEWVFDIKDHDVYWCTADIGWVTGHSYIVYGPLANGATGVMYEGTPDFPDKDRFWRIVEKHGVSILYTAPTAIRTFMRWGEKYPEQCDLSSLRLLGSVGEPINPEAWVWYWRVIGGGRCPVVDTWWQTETGHILITPLPGVTVCKPGSATKPFPGVDAAVLDDHGKPAKAGYLVLRQPWPGMLRGIWGDPERYVKQYWSRYKDIYFTGDGAKLDEDGYFWLLGRVDDVINVSGHRVSTMEVESALVDHPLVAESAVIGRSHEIKGQALAAFVTVKEGVATSLELGDELKAHVVKKIGALARPDDIIFSADLPKTRSGKIMRRLLRDIAEGRALGDTTTLADPAVVARLKTKYEEQE